MGTVCVYTQHIHTSYKYVICIMLCIPVLLVPYTFILSLPLCTFVLPLSPSNIVSLLQLHTKLDVPSLFIFSLLPSSAHKHPHRHRTITKGRNRCTAHAYTHTHAQTWFSSLLLGFFCLFPRHSVFPFFIQPIVHSSCSIACYSYVFMLSFLPPHMQLPHTTKHRNIK